MSLPTATAAKVLAYYLAARGYGDWDADPRPDWPVSYYSMPEEENHNWLTTYDTGSRKQVRRMRDGGWEQLHPVQVRIRAVGGVGDADDIANAKGKEISDDLDQLYVYQIAVEGKTYTIHHVSVQDKPTFLKQQERSGARDYVMNCFVRVVEEP